MKKPTNEIKNWFIGNSWNLAVTAVAIIVAFTYLKVEVKNNTDKLYALEARVAQYPSVDYFELKFNTLDENQLKISKNIEDLTKKVQDHIEE